MSGMSDWTAPLCVLALGAIVGIALAWRARAGRPDEGTGPLRDLEKKRDALLLQLQELEDTSAKRTPTQLAQERQALELEAARVLLALEDAGPARATPAPETPAPATPGERKPARRSQRGFWWGAASASAVLLLAFFVNSSARPREVGGSATGNLPSRDRDEPESEEAAQETAAGDPDDVATLLSLARQGMERRDYMSVWRQTAKVLQREPENPRALTYQAVVRLAMGQAGVAEKLLVQAVAADPRLLEARVYLALTYARLGRLDAARSTIAEAARRFPERSAELQQALSDAESEPAQPAEDADPHAGLATPGAARARAVPPAVRPAAEAARGGRRVAGRIELDPPARAVSRVLFVFVRNARAESGPPIAVKRLPAVFPASFDLSQADSMMGQEFPERVAVEARLASDGNPLTRDPSDPRARIDDVPAGRTDLRLVLRRP
jgi:tetratricopeptide (TPR) repeat protein